MSSRLDELTGVMSRSSQANANSLRTNNVSVARSSSGERGHVRGPGNFQQHLFNQMYKYILVWAFIDAYIFEHFLINAPEEVHRSTVKFQATINNQNYHH